jgi:hypothetical protein
MPLGPRRGFRARRRITALGCQEQIRRSLPDLSIEAFDGCPRLGFDSASPFGNTLEFDADSPTITK